MKIGDRVVFLSETGGGVVAGFQGKNIVLVEDADGFQIPMALNDVVVVDGNNDYSSAHSVESRKATANNEKQIPAAEPRKEELKEPVREIKEREGGDTLNVYLAFAPVDALNIGNTTFECYLVNDSNFFLSFTYLSAEASRWSLRCTDVVEPNTKYYIEELSHSQVSDIEHIQIQFIAYKKNRPFLIKDPVACDLKIDGMKFFKLHAFRQNLYFEQTALLFPLIKKNDIAMHDKTPKESAEVKSNENKSDGYVRRYEDRRRGGYPQRSNGDVMVVDLHSAELLETTSGMSNTEILQYQLSYFNKVMSEQIKHRGKKIVFIHGKGEGVLRQSIIRDLKYKYKSCIYQDASFQEYGYGATQVTIR